TSLPPVAAVSGLSSLAFCCLFCLSIRRPPRSTLFPTRRSSDLAWHLAGLGLRRRHQPPHRPAHRQGHGAHLAAPPGHRHPAPDRSEEHTSELQSRENLVCRLLLEKKK